MRVVTLLLAMTVAARAQDASLPPELPWKGKSLDLLLPADHEWATDFEKSGMKATPRYDAMVEWLWRLVAVAPDLQMVSLAKSDEGRDIWMVIASKERAFTPAALRASKRPSMLAVGGIHAGEIDGKDAGLMLLRDLTVRDKARALLDKANLLFVPILSVDGHERFSRYARINQRGPVEMGWRTNSRNLNLNRDFTKVDTPEVRALVGVFNELEPELYFDLHVTDGADYQYDITWGYSGPHAHSPAIATWLQQNLDPALQRDLKAMGHIPGPLVFGDGATRNAAPTFGPRFSNGYGDLRHLPSVLVENHSLKPYRQRVLGTYVFLRSALDVLGKEGAGLRAAIEADRKRRPKNVPLAWKRPDGDPPKVKFLGVEREVRDEPITGGKRVVWTGKPVTLEVDLLAETEPARTVRRPAAYWIPSAWQNVIARLGVHGVQMERLETSREVEVELYRVTDHKLAGAPFEGHMRVDGTFVAEKHTVVYPPRSARVPTDQPLGDLVVLLLEPASADSFFQWGFFLEILQRTEYAENYVMAPLAERMLAKDKGLEKAYRKRVEEDEAFAKDPRARLQWFYERTPYFDARWRLYPVGRE